jgi:nucleoside phosphorylase
MTLYLTNDALDWSLQHHKRFGDTDLFPTAFEFEVADEQWVELRKQLAARDLVTHKWRRGRTLLVMKDKVSFRRATQFDPIDSILFAALIWTIGPAIEARRLARDRNAVFSYRYAPSSSGQLFAPGKAKQPFWTHTVAACGAHKSPWLVITDIVDFYGQIKHSYLEAQLTSAAPAEHAAAVMRALSAAQDDSEIGIPVGPHSTHLLAELSLAAFDDFMADSGYVHTRFVDDIHVVCESEDEAREALFDIAQYMHSNLKLSLSRHKTRVLGAEELRQFAQMALGVPDAGDGEARKRVQRLIQKHISVDRDDDLAAEPGEHSELTSKNLGDILGGLLAEDSQIRLRQSLKSLAHMGAPGAIGFVVGRLAELLPVLPEAMNYLADTLPNFEGDRREVFKDLMAALDLPILLKSEHMQMLIFAMFVKFPDDVDFKKISQRYRTTFPAARREILLLAGKKGRAGWLAPHVADAVDADPWLLRALVEASRCLDEKDRRKLKELAKKRKGAVAWLLEDPLHHDRKPSVAGRLAQGVLKAANKQQILLSLGGAADLSACESLAHRYGGTFDRVDGERAVFRLDTERLLADAENGRLGEEVLEIVLADGQCLYERLPTVTFASPAEDDIELAQLKSILKQTDLLIVTTADIEKRAVLSKLQPLSGQSKLVVGSLGNVSYRIGQFGRYAAAHVHTTQGADGRHGATLYVRDAIAGGKFKACILIGIAFGFDRSKQRLGDVLVAERIQPYEHAKIEGNQEVIKPRGDLMQCGPVLSERFRNRMSDWSQRRAITDVKLQQGTLLAGGKLVNSRPFRDRLYQTFEALKPIGGEMEGHGAYAAAELGKVEVILVKAICDWADGAKSDYAQSFAAHTAVDACHHLLSKPDVLDLLKAKDLGVLEPEPANLPDVSGFLKRKPRAPARGSSSGWNDAGDVDF